MRKINPDDKMSFGIAHDNWLDEGNPYEDEPRPGYDWCLECGEDTWSLEFHQCERCGFVD